MSTNTFENIIGRFSVEHDKVVEEALFNDIQLRIVKREETELISPFLKFLKQDKYKKAFRERNILITKKKIKESINTDNFICQAINTIKDIDKTANTLVKRLREWYALYNPEFTASIDNQEKFTELILKKSRTKLLSEIGRTHTMGADLQKQDLHVILNYAENIHNLYEEKKSITAYLDKIMQVHCPNLKYLAGTLIAAKLIEHKGSLKRLMLLPASTMQILGAEKALFRHLTTGARPPKYGYILNHPFVQAGKRQQRGKRARLLADKLTICARLDYFKGDFLAPKYKKVMDSKVE